MSTLKPREAEFVIYQGDDLARLSELHQAAEVARRRIEASEGTPLRAGDARPSAEAEEQAYADFVAEAAERAVVVRVRAIGRRRFRDLMSAHPPREVDGETHPDDAPYEVNTATFPDALLRFVDDEDDTIRTVVEPDLAPAKLRAFIEDELAEGDFEGIWLGAYFLNRSPSADPKARLSSSGSPRSTET